LLTPPSPLAHSFLMGERGDPAVLKRSAAGLTAQPVERFRPDRPFAYAAGMGEGDGG